MENENWIRLLIFVGFFVVLAVIETLWPRRERSQPRCSRWFVNLTLIIMGTLALRLLATILPLLAVGAAINANTQAWGFLAWVSWKNWVEIIIGVLLLDGVIWFQHWLTHKLPILWRLHRVHHCDRDIDVSTALRFHPLEILVSMFIKIGAIYMIGAPIISVVVFEILLNATAMFNHANIKLPYRFDKYLRLLIVTPDMHRVHHSVNRSEHNKNYGFCLSVWDRLFQTYAIEPQDGHEQMRIGLDRWQDDKPTKLVWTLLLPFKTH